MMMQLFLLWRPGSGLDLYWVIMAELEVIGDRYLVVLSGQMRMSPLSVFTVLSPPKRTSIDEYGACPAQNRLSEG